MVENRITAGPGWEGIHNEGEIEYIDLEESGIQDAGCWFLGTGCLMPLQNTECRGTMPVPGNP